MYENPEDSYHHRDEKNSCSNRPVFTVHGHEISNTQYKIYVDMGTQTGHKNSNTKTTTQKSDEFLNSLRRKMMSDLSFTIISNYSKNDK